LVYSKTFGRSLKNEDLIVLKPKGQGVLITLVHQIKKTIKGAGKLP
jgi:hypothetical protein